MVTLLIISSKREFLNSDESYYFIRVIGQYGPAKLDLIILTTLYINDEQCSLNTHHSTSFTIVSIILILNSCNTHSEHHTEKSNCVQCV